MEKMWKETRRNEGDREGRDEKVGEGLEKGR